VGYRAISSSATTVDDLQTPQRPLPVPDETVQTHPCPSAPCFARLGAGPARRACSRTLATLGFVCGTCRRRRRSSERRRCPVPRCNSGMGQGSRGSSDVTGDAVRSAERSSPCVGRRRVHVCRLVLTQLLNSPPVHVFHRGLCVATNAARRLDYWVECSPGCGRGCR